jgi:phosphoribosylformimino-5-aminoimidazole carboxamide ribotide isomerase
MILYPAIDLLDGNCVRLYKGDRNQATVYASDPVKMAKQFVEQGTKVLHVVNLNGAFDGDNVNLKVIDAIRAAVDVPIQVGGGIRTAEQAEALLKKGVNVILGTLLVQNPEAMRPLAEAYPGRLIASIDCKNGIMTSHGWQTTSDITAEDMIQTVIDIGIRKIVYTDIAKDGTLEGPNMEMIQKLQTTFDIDLIASGGVGTLDDLKALKAVGVSGVIVGKALYEGRFTLKEALEVSYVD